MQQFIFECSLWLDRPREEVFDFFADALNLQEITPPWVHFRVLTPPPIQMRVGALIDYRIQVHGVPLRWQTKITQWNPPVSFEDVQLRGPYKLWEHLHTFEEDRGGTLCRDRVRYMPVGGRLTHWLFVRRDVERIFQHRRRALLKRFPSLTPSTSPAQVSS
ncbi:MAG: SRPBCC family protein [Verrucomicrobia bacterium]|nr:SRPBCC family protein [Verrucomicrobiota bacterium]